jgi:hypothetical protein
VGSLQDSKRLLVQLKVLLRDGRTFVHKIRPLYFNDVRRWRRLGRRYLEQVYGEGSAEGQLFSRLTEQAFSFLPMRSGHIDKVEVIEGAEVIVVGSGDDRVSHLNKLEFSNALHILIEAARRLRDEIGSHGKSVAPERVSASEDPIDRKARVEAFLMRCNRELSFKVLKKHISAAAKHKTARQFQHWQASSKDATTQDNATFPLILAMSPQAFHERLSKLNVKGVPAVETR